MVVIIEENIADAVSPVISEAQTDDMGTKFISDFDVKRAIEPIIALLSPIADKCHNVRLEAGYVAELVLKKIGYLRGYHPFLGRQDRNTYYLDPDFCFKP
jgi:hypothetical protein